MVLMLSRSMSCWETLFASSRSDVALMSGGTGEVEGITVTLMQSFRAGFRRRSNLERGCEWLGAFAPATPLHAVKLFLPVWPSPSRYLGAIDTVLVCVGTAGDLLVPEFLLGMSADFLQARDPVNGIDRKAEAINFIVHRQLHRSIDVAFLLVAPHMQALVLASVGE